MQNNFYFLRHLVKAITPELEGKSIAACFSQQKDELILGFCDDSSSLYVKASLLAEFSCLSFHDDFRRTKKNSVNIFQQVLGHVVVSIKQALNERAFVIYFEEDYALYFKMHGNRSNIILFHKEKPIALFKNRLSNDKTLTLAGMDRKIDQSHAAFIETGGNFNVLYPTFGKVIKRYLQQQEYDNKLIEDQWQIIVTLLDILSKPQYYILNADHKIIFSMVPLGVIMEQFKDPVKAVTQFYYTYQKHSQFSKEKASMIKTLETKKRQTENYIQKTRAKLINIEDSRKNEEIANIIMANLHQIPANKNMVDLFDFYQNKNIKIKLKPLLSPQKNAEQYYRKAKNQKLETNKLKDNLANKNKELETLNNNLDIIRGTQDLTALRQYNKANPPEKKQQTKAVPYKKFHFQGYDILVGKHAAANDELTLKVARKEDLWLHARDVSGSHVVVRNQGNKNFPSNVIELAASLAAFYSKRKNDTLCPVIYTYKKYVRKPKSALPGQVIVEKQQVMLVEPKNFVS